MSVLSNRLWRVVAAGVVSSVLGAVGGVAAAPQAEETAGERPDALEVALSSRDAASEGARRHYEASGYRGLWIGPEGDDDRAQDLLDALERADEHALPSQRYGVGALRAALASIGPAGSANVANTELALTQAFLRYARDLSSGLLEPNAVDREIHISPPRSDERRLLADLADAPSVEVLLAGLPPTDPGYGRLMTHLAELRAEQGDGWKRGTLGGPSISPGDRGPRVGALRARLIALGDHETETESAQQDRLDGALVESVRMFQKRHGLNADGIAGRRTFEALNASIEDRIGQVMVNMERMRWLNRELGRRHIVVNQADFTVKLYQDGETLFDERVVVGQAARHRTPEFIDEMQHLVFNPTWHLPRSIATEEILPKLKADPLYLSKRNMRLVPTGGGPPPDALLTDWTLYSASDFPFRVKQAPGSGNALGRVKFMFPNRFAIYLHDTPSKNLFNKDARAFSHGCIRVRDPMRLAELLLRPQEADPAAFIDRLLARGREATVRLAETVPVYLTYRTVWIADDGEAEYRDDIYGRDARVLNALTAAGVARPAEG